MELKIYKKLLIIFLTLTIISGVVLAVFDITYHMTGTVESEEVTAYEDAGCTIALDPVLHDWGNVKNGDTKSIWIKNVGSVTVDVTIAISNEVDCTISPSWTAHYGLTTQASVQLDLTISTTALAGTPISWHVDITSNKV